jgi:hypothetical protein
MADDNRQLLVAAMTSEHFVMQGAVSNAVNEGGSRANMYLGVLSGSLVAMGFATQTEAIFVPFVATVLPAIFVMGIFTVLRLVDISIDSTKALITISRIHRYYRELGGEAAEIFDMRMGRWPETSNPADRLGTLVAYWTSAASMIAAINSLVGAAGLTLLLHLAFDRGLLASIAAGAAAAIALLFGFHQLQRMRVTEIERFARDIAGIDPDAGGKYR